MNDTVVPEVFEVVLPEPERTPLERDQAAFFRLLPGLMRTHYGQYVAVHDDRVVDAGPVRLDVALRAQAAVGGGVFVGLVSEEPIPVVRSGLRRVVRGIGQ